MAWLKLTEPPQREQERELVLRSGEAVPVRWVRDARARRLRLIVNDRGVRLTVPRSTSVPSRFTIWIWHCFCPGSGFANIACTSSPSKEGLR